MQALLLILLLVVCAAIAAAGYGSLLSAGLRIKPNLGDRGILGLLCFGFLGSLLHLLVPLTPNVHLAVLAGGIVCALIFRTDLWNSRIGWAALAIIFVYAAAHPQAQLNPDTGLYHMQTLRWMTEYSIVPGLVNLHSRLAYNSMIFPMTGIVDQAGLGWIPNLLVVLFVLFSLFARLRTGSTDRKSGLQFWCLLLSIVVLLADTQFSVLGWYGVMNADIFSAILVIYCTNIAIGLSASAKVETDLATLALATLLACMVKLAALPLLLLVAGLAWMHRRQLPALTAIRVSSVAALVVGLWMLRGLILSGCAVYPVSETCAYNLPWASTEQLVRNDSGWIKSYPRNSKDSPDHVLKDWAWLPGWEERMVKLPAVRLFLVCVPLGLLGALFRKKIHGDLANGLLTTSLGLAACLTFWFLTAPDIRFGFGFILGAALVSASVALTAVFKQPRVGVYAPTVVLVIMSLAGIRLLHDVAEHHHLNADGTLTVSAWHYFYMIPKSATYEGRVDDKRSVFVTKGEAAGLCWNHPLPCTPYFDAHELTAIRKVRWPVGLIAGLALPHETATNGKGSPHPSE